MNTGRCILRFVAFRDDNEALRQRVQVLEGELETLTEELDEAKTPKVRVELELEPEPAPEPAPPDADLAERIAAQEAQRVHAEAVKRQREGEAKKARARGRRESKIVVGDGQTHLTLQRGVLGQIRKKLFMTLVMFPSFAVLSFPLIMFLESIMPQGNAFYVGAALYAALYVLGTLLYAHFTRPQVELHIGDGNFELKNRGRSRMIGRADDLSISVSLPTADGRMGGRMQLSCRGEVFTIDELSLTDAEHLKPLE